MDMSAVAIEMGKQALILSLVISAPILAAGLLVGLLISILQAVTQIHEMTLAFVPKIIAMTLVAIFFLPWMIQKMLDYTQEVFVNFPILIH